MRKWFQLCINFLSTDSDRSVNPETNDEEPKTIVEAIFDEMTWALPSLTGSLALWLPDGWKQYAMYATAVAIVITVIYQCRRHKRKPPNHKAKEIRALTVILVLAVVLLSCCIVFFDRSVAEATPQAEATAPAVLTEETDKILGWEKIVSAMPGDTILFGEYCQSSWVGDKQPIEWLPQWF